MVWFLLCALVFGVSSSKEAICSRTGEYLEKASNVYTTRNIRNTIAEFSRTPPNTEVTKFNGQPISHMEALYKIKDFSSPLVISWDCRQRETLLEYSAKNATHSWTASVDEKLKERSDENVTAYFLEKGSSARKWLKYLKKNDALPSDTNEEDCEELFIWRDASQLFFHFLQHKPDSGSVDRFVFKDVKHFQYFTEKMVQSIPPGESPSDVVTCLQLFSEFPAHIFDDYDAAAAYCETIGPIFKIHFPEKHAELLSYERILKTEDWKKFWVSLNQVPLASDLIKFGGRGVLKKLPQKKYPTSTNFCETRDDLFNQQIQGAKNYTLLFPEPNDVRITCAGLFTDCCMHFGHPEGSIYPLLSQRCENAAILTVQKKGKIVANSFVLLSHLLDDVKTPCLIINRLVMKKEVGREKIVELFSLFQRQFPEMHLYYPCEHKPEKEKWFIPKKQSESIFGLQSFRLGEVCRDTLTSFFSSLDKGINFLDAKKVSRIEEL